MPPSRTAGERPPVTLDVAADGVATICLDRPDSRNAVDPATMAALTAALAACADDPAVRLVVLRGNGKDFCAGADIAWMRAVEGRSREELLADTRGLQDVYRGLRACPQPTVALVQGAAMAAGLGMAAACDVVIARTTARFCVSEVRAGLVPAVLAPFLMRRIGPGPTRMLACTGLVVSAAEMHRLGLVHRLADDEAAAEAALRAVADSVLASSPEAIRMCKAMLDDLEDRTLADGLPAALRWAADSRTRPSAQEGLAAFLSKALPSWARGGRTPS
ncbi:enoyl-CoA hydratase-related protein [Azospirillum sp. ST 5-10]|uniref:enoyl-CoA hydratase-related protein n=1 Tax=unclassified Azospirillum TaxID=2630922 RepID=UPI003F4A281A